MSQAFAATARALRPSVVRIDVEMERPKLSRRNFQPDDVPPDMERLFERFFHFGDGEGMPMPGPGHGTGRGVIDGAGNIITNSHVAKRPARSRSHSPTGASSPPKSWEPIPRPTLP